ncbi:hypothetical protein AVEN_163121-1 [Araneus ventricosus]|uniref:Uncharacterized protein n=1 Tax=Araneus ventricosus TaxID=182803 RepID=A0A4Y2DH10_ARAVE|nr:hypothetical protein AVEN_163121-1 [Araneus ventricosus]
MSDVSKTRDEVENHPESDGLVSYAHFLTTCDSCVWEGKTLANQFKSHPESADKIVKIHETVKRTIEEDDVRRTKYLLKYYPPKVEEKFPQSCCCEDEGDNRNIMESH